MIHSGANVKLTRIIVDSINVSELPQLNLRCEVAAEGCPVTPIVYEIAPTELLRGTTSVGTVKP